MRDFCLEAGGKSGLELELRRAEQAEAFSELVPQELFGVIQRFERSALLLRGAAQDQADVRVAEIGGKMDFGNGNGADARVRHFVADEFLELFANALRDSLGAVWVQVSA